MTNVDGWRAVRMVAGRELRVRLTSRAFKITTVILLIVVVGLSVAVKLIGNVGGSAVGFTPSASALAQPLQSLAGATNQSITVRVVDQAAGEQMLRDGDLDALVTGEPTNFQVVVKQDLSDTLRSSFNVLARQLALDQQLIKAGADPAAVAAAVNAATVDVRTLEPPRAFQTQRFVLSIIVGILVYIALLIYGPVVAQGVVEEKSNRIVEILLTTIRPWQLMLGKVFGIGLVGLMQLTAVVGVGAATAVLTRTISFPTSIAATVAAWVVLWFLLGYLAYALMFAALGALVSRQEDVGGVIAPALMFIIIPYVLGIAILPSNPDNTFLAVLSMIPLFSPTLMPIRIALGVAPAWQLALSVSLTALMLVGLVWLAGRVYGNAVLRMGSRVKFRDALRAAG
jgi:ABC-2 type transport system permease protein